MSKILTLNQRRDLERCDSLALKRNRLFEAEEEEQDRGSHFSPLLKGEQAQVPGPTNTQAGRIILSSFRGSYKIREVLWG